MKAPTSCAYSTIYFYLCMVLPIPIAFGFQCQLPKAKCNISTASNFHVHNVHIPRARTRGRTRTCTRTYAKRRNLTTLNSNSSQNESSKSSRGVIPVLSQKTSYRISSMLNLLSSLAIFIMPNRIEPTLLKRYPASKVAGATGFALAAGISYILGNHEYHNSNNNSSNSSSSSVGGAVAPLRGETDIETAISKQTHKKLNFGIMMFSFIGLSAIPGEASFHPSFQGAMIVFGIMSLARFMGGWVGFKGWLDCNGIDVFKKNVRTSISTSTNRGILIRDLIMECKRGVRQTWFDDSGSTHVNIEQGKGKQGTRKKKNIFSLCYWCALVGIVNNALSFYHAGKASTSIPFNKSIHISAIARLSLISSIASTLKVAAWKGRLNEAPFVQLKYMLCAWAGLVGVASGFIDANLISFILQKAVYFMIFAWPIMYKGRRGGDNDVEDEEGTEREE